MLEHANSRQTSVVNLCINGARGHKIEDCDCLAFLAILILLCTLISYVLMNYWQARVSATEAALSSAQGASITLS